jgi:integral membrane protein
MKQLFKTSLGRLRLVGYLEGISLILLLGVGVPLKYMASDPGMVKTIGPLHGILFLWFVFSTLSVGVEKQWRWQTTWKVLIACVIPFGTFYIDRYILRQAAERDQAKG